ncbi:MULTISPECIES: DUF416 family protein [unclassified Lysobacter]|nr:MULTISPECIES: DUF416 family protein [unclassified Lysobacter]
MVHVEPLICRHLGPDSGWRRVAFMAWCCEPMLQNYLIYHNDTGLGSPQLLREGLDLIWGVARADIAFPKSRHVISLSRQQKPGWLHGSKPYARSADEACFGIHHTLVSMRSPTLSDALDVSDAAIYSIEIQDRNQLPITAEQLWDRERRVRSEQARQVRCLERLSAAPDADRSKVVAGLRKRAMRTKASLQRAGAGTSRRPTTSDAMNRAV